MEEMAHMKFSEKLDHILRQYSYKRKRGYSRYKKNNDFDVEEYLDEINSYIDEIIEEIDRFIPKSKRR